MKKILVLFLLIIFAFPQASFSASWRDIPFSFNGKQVTMKSFQGNVVILMFWATWCPYCQQQMPQASVLKNYYSKQKNIKILAISTDREGDDIVKEYYAASGLTNLDVVTNSDKNLFKALGLIGVPTILLVSKDGQIIGSYNKLNEIDQKLVQSLAK